MHDIDNGADRLSTPGPQALPAGLRTARRVAAAVWLGASLVQFVTWLLICTIGLRLVSPWWLWTVLVGGFLVGGLWWFTENAYGTGRVDRTDRRVTR